MEFDHDVLIKILEYLLTADKRSLGMVNRFYRTAIQAHFIQQVCLNPKNISNFSQKLKSPMNIKKLTIRGEFEDFFVFKNIFTLITCTILDLESNFHTEIAFPESFASTVEKLILHDDDLNCFDLSKFEKLNEISLHSHTDGKAVASQLQKYPNIRNVSVIDCYFEAHSELEDYVFGDHQALDTVRVTHGVPQIKNLYSENATVVYNGIIFELFSLTPNWYPFLVKLVLRRNPIASLKSLKHHHNLEYFDLENEQEIDLLDVEFAPALKYLFLEAGFIQMNQNLLQFPFKSLRLVCSNLWNKSSVTSNPKPDRIDIVTSKGKVVKDAKQWYLYKEKWTRLEDDIIGWVSINEVCIYLYFFIKVV